MKTDAKPMIQNNSNGSSLLITLLIVLLVVAIIIPFLDVLVLEMSIASNQGQRISAFYLADAGIGFAHYQLSTTAGTWSPATTPYYLTYNNATIGSYTINLSTTYNTYGFLFYQVNSIGQVLNSLAMASVQAVFRSDSYGDYMFLINQLNSNTMFGSEDYVTGRVQCNSNLYYTGTPTFLRFVTVSGVLSPSGTANPNFMEGYITGAPQRSLPSTSSFTSLKTYAQQSGLYIAAIGQVTVSLNTTSLTISWVTASKSTTVNYTLTSTNGIVYIDTNTTLNISGTLDGALTIVSKTIGITGNILYKDTTATSNDVLGLISQTDIQVMNSVPNDFYCDCQMIASSGQFWYNLTSGSLKHSLNVYGAIAVSVMSAFTNGSKGFPTQNWLYDDRLKFLQPPYYLKTDNRVYDTIYWGNAYFI